MIVTATRLVVSTCRTVYAWNARETITIWIATAPAKKQSLDIAGQSTSQVVLNAQMKI